MYSVIYSMIYIIEYISLKKKLLNANEEKKKIHIYIYIHMDICCISNERPKLTLFFI